MKENKPEVTIRQESILTLVDGIKFKDWNIDIDQSVIDEIRDRDAIIFKQLFPKEFLYGLKKLITEHKFTANDYRDCGNGLPGNMFRIDDLKDRKFAARFIQIYCFTLWDQDTPDVFLKLMRVWGRFMNKMRGVKIDSQFDSNEEFTFWLNAYHYPPTGFVGRHHRFGLADYINEKVPFTESIAFCSKIGGDFETGGLYLGGRKHDSKTMHYIEPYIDWGDVLFFVNDLHHEIKVIDENKEADMDPMKNRFILDLTSVDLKELRKLV